MTPAHAAGIAKRARKLLRAGLLTHRDLCLLDTLLWSCRTPGADLARVSYTRLQRLARMARSTISDGLARLEGLGLLQRLKRRLRVRWGRGATASRQDVTTYRLLVQAPAPARTEFTSRTVDSGPDSSSLLSPREAVDKSDGMELALARLEQSWLGKKAREAAVYA